VIAGLNILLEQQKLILAAEEIVSIHRVASDVLHDISRVEQRFKNELIQKRIDSLLNQKHRQARLELHFWGNSLLSRGGLRPVNRQLEPPAVTQAGHGYSPPIASKRRSLNLAERAFVSPAILCKLSCHSTAYCRNLPLEPLHVCLADVIVVDSVSSRSAVSGRTSPGSCEFD
jgi:hypothetical protein